MKITMPCLYVKFESYGLHGTHETPAQERSYYDQQAIHIKGYSRSLLLAVFPEPERDILEIKWKMKQTRAIFITTVSLILILLTNLTSALGCNRCSNPLINLVCCFFLQQCCSNGTTEPTQIAPLNSGSAEEPIYLPGH
ncbi:uncharacterized protein LOC143248504 [Tachypleus tridentatus]|uniref:uncharacterized protein LOC143248504 n=1 Tax=Tachypleus tridentatus TaxID=6853 RepID=UPI003FD4759C